MRTVIALAVVGAAAVAGIAFVMRSPLRGAGAAVIESAANASAPVSASASAMPSAENVLADRLARGEIGEDEYRQRAEAAGG